MQAYLLRQMFGLCANSRSGFLLVIKRKGKIVCFDLEILMHCAVRAWVSKKREELYKSGGRFVRAH